MLKRELERVSKVIGDVLAADDFAATVRPDYLRRAVLDYPLRGGKRIRPALLLWSATLFGGDENAALYPAAAVEVWHNWTLVHDDIIDQDAARRGQPTCHVTLRSDMAKLIADPAEVNRNAESFAILAGDLQQGWANHLILKTPVKPELVIAILKKLQNLANNELITGEALDVEFALRPATGVTETEIEEMLYLKTGALLSFAMQTGAIIGLGKAEDPRIDLLAGFAAKIGILFQLRDDYLGIYGNFAEFGKPILGDLREGKSTVILARTLAAGNDEILQYLGKKEYSVADTAAVRRLMQPGADAVLKKCEALSQEAKAILARLPDHQSRALLHELADYFLTRDK